jgi:hypothetical protein
MRLSTWSSDHFHEVHDVDVAEALQQLDLTNGAHRKLVRDSHMAAVAATVRVRHVLACAQHTEAHGASATMRDHAREKTTGTRSGHDGFQLRRCARWRDGDGRCETSRRRRSQQHTRVCETAARGTAHTAPTPCVSPSHLTRFSATRVPVFLSTARRTTLRTHNKHQEQQHSASGSQCRRLRHTASRPATARRAPRAKASQMA